VSIRQDPVERRATALILLAIAWISLTVGRVVWADEAAPWWSPFALWALLILLGAGLARPIAGERDEEER